MVDVTVDVTVVTRHNKHVQYSSKQNFIMNDTLDSQSTVHL